MRRLLLVVAFVVCVAPPAAAQVRVEKNVIYGMYSGLALLMDVHQADRPNGYGIVFVSGSGWQARLGYGATGLKEGQVDVWVTPLARAGYTVFTINHRGAPRFHYPAAVEDVQRAVRFVRQHAKRFGVDPDRIGGVGGSSGAHLVGLVAALGASGTADDSDPVGRQPATLQCVVLVAGPGDLAKMIGTSGIATAAVVSFLEHGPTPDAQKIYRAASPITHVSPSTPPALLIHGDADETVPFHQSLDMEAALRATQVPVKLVRVPGGTHGADFGRGGTPHLQFQDVLKEAIGWLDRYLKAPKQP